MRHNACTLTVLGLAALLTVNPLTAVAQQAPIDVIAHDLSFAIARCYVPPKDVAPPYPAVGLLFNFRPDGRLDGPPQLTDPPGGGPKVAAIRDAVLAAAVRCARIDQAVRFRQVYGEWKALRMFFKPGPAK